MLAAGEPPPPPPQAAAGDPAAEAEASDGLVEEPDGSDDAAGAPPPTSATSADLSVLDPLRDPAALQECLADLEVGRPALTVDYALFEGRPAVVVVYPGREAGGLDVVVVGPGCADELRLFLRVPPA